MTKHTKHNTIQINDIQTKGDKSDTFYRGFILSLYTHSKTSTIRQFYTNIVTSITSAEANPLRDI
ncbi:hypothetical protein KL86DYS2_10532 [uncultured Dysgonomonas sp.]|uniref:Uncharacterized protein n=1 Tax=uncultured Dysgonomonas sp. TaxID=206096 RepID=A0A212J1P8_9BACT|nr:hypothetical protein KL86DYS2_10532 [uncultured Dysgonomonas sp.]